MLWSCIKIRGHEYARLVHRPFIHHNYNARSPANPRPTVGRHRLPPQGAPYHNESRPEERYRPREKIRGSYRRRDPLSAGAGYDVLGAVDIRRRSLGRVLIVAWSAGFWAVRKVLARHARYSAGSGSYRPVQAVWIARVPVVDPLRVLLVSKIGAVVEVALLLGLCPCRSKQTENPTRGDGKGYGYSPHSSSPGSDRRHTSAEGG